MKEFELTLKLRNNLLKKRRLALGLKPRELAEAAGIGYQTYLRYENLKDGPLRKDGTWKRSAIDLSTFHKTTPDDLWPDALLAVRQSELVAELAAEEAFALSGYAQSIELPATPEELFLEKEKNQVVGEALATLHPRVQQVLLRRIVDEQTLREAGEDLLPAYGSRPHSISGERVRDLQNKGLSALENTRWMDDQTRSVAKKRAKLKEVK